MFWKCHLRLCYAVYSVFFCFYLLCNKHSWPCPVYSPSCVPEICSRARCQIDGVCEESLGMSASVYKDLVMTQKKILVQKVVYIFFRARAIRQMKNPWACVRRSLYKIVCGLFIIVGYVFVTSYKFTAKDSRILGRVCVSLSSFVYDTHYKVLSIKFCRKQMYFVRCYGEALRDVF